MTTVAILGAIRLSFPTEQDAAMAATRIELRLAPILGPIAEHGLDRIWDVHRVGRVVYVGRPEDLIEAIGGGR